DRVLEPPALHVDEEGAVVHRRPERARGRHGRERVADLAQTSAQPAEGVRRHRSDRASQLHAIGHLRSLRGSQAECPALTVKYRTDNVNPPLVHELTVADAAWKRRSS